MPGSKYILILIILIFTTSFSINNIYLTDDKQIFLSESNLEILKINNLNKSKLKLVYNIKNNEDYKRLENDIDLVEDFSCNLNEKTLICIIFRGQIKKFTVKPNTDNTSIYSFVIKSNSNDSIIRLDFTIDKDVKHFENELFKLFENINNFN